MILLVNLASCIFLGIFTVPNTIHTSQGNSQFPRYRSILLWVGIHALGILIPCHVPNV
jgi:hypothetical protein